MNQSRLKHLQDRIIGLEMNITLCESDLEAVLKDLKYLEDLKIELVENIGVLKEDKIIVVATEYKKSVEELKAVNKNISILNIEKEILITSIDKYNDMRDGYLIEYGLIKKMLDKIDVVLPFDQSKRKK